MTDPILYGIGSFKWLPENNIQGLCFATERTSAGTTVMYTVPAGKVFFVLNISLGLNSTNNANISVFATSSVGDMAIVSNRQYQTEAHNHIFCCVKLTAGQTISHTANGGSTASYVNISGVENDA